MWFKVYGNVLKACEKPGKDIAVTATMMTVVVTVVTTTGEAHPHMLVPVAIMAASMAGRIGMPTRGARRAVPPRAPGPATERARKDRRGPGGT